MASLKHQFIMDCIIRKMRLLGFEPICFDGGSTLASRFKIPPRIVRHRPDILAINSNCELCVGEAKTRYDVDSKRTKEQIEDYHKSSAYVLIGCPSSVFSHMKGTVQHLVGESPRISVIKIPDILLPREENEELHF